MAQDRSRARTINEVINSTWPALVVMTEHLADILKRNGLTGDVKLELQVLRSDDSVMPVELITRTTKAEIRRYRV